MATAASTALPPAFSTSTPIWVASARPVDTTPFLPWASRPPKVTFSPPTAAGVSVGWGVLLAAGAPQAVRHRAAARAADARRSKPFRLFMANFLP